ESTPATIRNPGGSLAISGNGRIQARTLEPFQMFARKLDSQSITSGQTYKNVIGWSPEWDDFGALNASTGELTIPTTGWYEVYVRLVYSANFSGNEGHRVAAIGKNGTTVFARQLVPPPW